MNKNEGPSHEKKEQVFTVEAARLEDAAGIARVREETWLATYPNPNLKKPITKEDILSKKLQSEDQVNRWRKGIESVRGQRKIWVAKNEAGMVVGYGQGIKGDTENEVGGMYVLPTYHGQGLGKKLMETVLDWLGDYKRTVLFVAEYSASAIEFYKRFGFVEVEEPGERLVFASGAEANLIKMARPRKDRVRDEVV